MGKRNTLKLTTSGITQILQRLDKLGGNVSKVAKDALEQAGETIGEDTYAAVQPGNLPAKGKYSTGKTADSVVRNPRVVDEGTRLSIGVGFDYNKEGAGGYLISGRPKGKTGQMNPVPELEQIYKRKKYMNQIVQDMSEIVQDEISRAIGGGKK